jgi:hypothetical protein
MALMASPSPRHRFQFRLRDLFCVTLLVATWAWGMRILAAICEPDSGWLFFVASFYCTAVAGIGIWMFLRAGVRHQQRATDKEKSGFPMLGDSQEPEMRQAFRWMAGAVAAFCLVLGVFIALRQSDIPLAFYVALALGLEMATIVLRGKLPWRGREKDRRFQFRLRTLMIVVTLLAIPCGYVGWQAKIVRERKSVLAEIEGVGGGFFSDLRTTTGFWNRFPNWPDEAIASIDGNRQLRAPAKEIVRTLLGDEGVIVIWLPTTVAPAVDARIKLAIPEAYVWRFK